MRLKNQAPLESDLPRYMHIPAASHILYPHLQPPVCSSRFCQLSLCGRGTICGDTVGGSLQGEDRGYGEGVVITIGSLQGKRG